MYAHLINYYFATDFVYEHVKCEYLNFVYVYQIGSTGFARSYYLNSLILTFKLR